MAETAPTILFANLNLAQTPQIARPLEWLGDFVKEAGFDGVEYTPVLPHLHSPRALGRAVSKGHIDIESLHATFRTTKQSHHLYPDPGKKEGHIPSRVEQVLSSPLGGLIMPDARDSAGFMRRAQQRMNHKLPGVLYPLADRLLDVAQQETAGLSRPLFQPMEHQAAAVGATTLFGFHMEMHDIRNYGYVIDTFHLRRRYGADQSGTINNIEASVPFLAPYTEAVHVSLYRKDIPGEDHIPGLKEAQAALRGEYTGEIRFMLDVLKEKGNVKYMVVEATSNAIAEAAEISTLEDIQLAYRDIAEGLADYWDRG